MFSISARVRQRRTRRPGFRPIPVHSLGPVEGGAYYQIAEHRACSQVGKDPVERITAAPRGDDPRISYLATARAVCQRNGLA